MELVGELVARPARALAETVASLNHEPVDHAVEDDAIVEGPVLSLPGDRILPFFGALRKADEIGDGLGGFLLEQADGERTFGGIETRVRARLSRHESLS
jgi:hypothetical protein